MMTTRPTQAFFDISTENSTTTVTATTTSIISGDDSNDEKLILSVAVPTSVIVLAVFVVSAIFCYNRYRRKCQLQRDLTPYYAYDQTEVDISDGIAYNSVSNSTDLICVVADTAYHSKEEETNLLETDNNDNHTSQRMNSVTV